MARKNDERVHLRIPKELKAWAVEYVGDRNTNLSSLVVRLLTEVRSAEESKKNPPDAEQI